MLQAPANVKAASPNTVPGITVLALRDFLQHKFGDESLSAMLQQGCLPRHHVLNVVDPRLALHDAIPDAAVTTVVCAVLEASSQQLDDLMFEFGQFLLAWVTHQSGYQEAICRVSSTFVGFARCLNQLLVQMYGSLGFKQPRFPGAQVTEVTSTSFVLGAITPTTTTFSSMICLPVYQGILDRVATSLYGMTVQFSECRDTRLSTGRVYKSCRVTFDGCSTPAPSPTTAPLALGANAGLGDHITGLDPETFNKLFPFHFLLDMNFRVLQAGQALKKVLPQMAQAGVHIQDVLTIRLPRVLWNLDCIARGILDSDVGVKVLLASHAGAGLDLCGSLYRVQQLRRGSAPASAANAQPTTGNGVTDGGVALLFVGSPYLTGLEDLDKYNLYLSDFAAHDSAPDHVLQAAANDAQVAGGVRELQRVNAELKAALADSLRQTAAPPCGLLRDGSPGGDGEGREAAASLAKSAGHSVIALLDSLLMGGNVDARQVLAARNALARAGSKVWECTAADGAQTSVKDAEVKASLARMLGMGTRGVNGSKSASIGSVGVCSGAEQATVLSLPSAAVPDVVRQASAPNARIRARPACGAEAALGVVAAADRSCDSPHSTWSQSAPSSSLALTYATAELDDRMFCDAVVGCIDALGDPIGTQQQPAERLPGAAAMRSASAQGGAVSMPTSSASSGLTSPRAASKSWVKGMMDMLTPFGSKGCD